MACNKYHDHLLVLPEDDPNRQMANGFILHYALRPRAIQVMSVAGGWRKAMKALENNLIKTLLEYPNRRLLLVIDFDNDFDARLQDFRALIPNHIKDRVFLLGTLTEPEDLSRSLQISFESIGKGLSEECADNKYLLWHHGLLEHNQDELKRLVSNVRPFLFN